MKKNLRLKFLFFIFIIVFTVECKQILKRALYVFILYTIILLFCVDTKNLSFSNSRKHTVP